MNSHAIISKKHVRNMILQSLGRASATTAYIALIAIFLSSGEKLFGAQDNELLIPIFMLLLFVISATVTGYLVLGKPVMLYHAGDKKGAFSFLVATVGWLAAFLVLVGIAMALA